jgi:hypothetical protein
MRSAILRSIRTASAGLVSGRTRTRTSAPAMSSIVWDVQSSSSREAEARTPATGDTGRLEAGRAGSGGWRLEPANPLDGEARRRGRVRLGTTLPRPSYQRKKKEGPGSWPLFYVLLCTSPSWLLVAELVTSARGDHERGEHGQHVGRAHSSILHDGSPLERGDVPSHHWGSRRGVPVPGRVNRWWAAPHSSSSVDTSVGV